MQLAPPVLGQTVKCGAFTCRTRLILIRTVTALPALRVLQTQMAKPARCPGRICDELANGWTDTQS